VEQLVAEGPAAALPQLVVADTRVALGTLAAAWRERLSLPLITVTGSNGKTTTTQMIAAILSAAFGEHDGQARWFATRGNRNNEIGVPLMLLELRPAHRAAVLELGMNHPGEIARLSAWARPDVALVTNAQREHQEFLDSVAATARENGAAIEALSAGGTAVFPADDECAPIWRARAGARRIVDFAIAGDAVVRAEADLRAQGCSVLLHAPGLQAQGLHAQDPHAPSPAASHAAGQTPGGTIAIELQVAGLHNARNALAAAAACLAAGIDGVAIAAGLAAFTPVGGRGTRGRAAGGALLIDESYNANPDSVRAAIDLLAGQGAPRVLVLGDMGEVGTRGPEYHREVGAYARARGVEFLLALGPQAGLAAQAFGSGASHFDTVEDLIKEARSLTLAQPHSTVLVKGSRFMRLERVVTALAQAPGQGAGQHA
jgi:UDP-N-acetylmuramyl pentapeptide synthase